MTTADAIVYRIISGGINAAFHDTHSDTESSDARGVATGVYRYIYPPNQSTLQIFMWLLVVFFSL